MEIEQGILLPSYEIPKGEDKNTFSYDSMKNVDYSKLEKSEKFTPALYHEKDGIWEGGSTSQFSPVMTFKLGGAECHWLIFVTTFWGSGIINIDGVKWDMVLIFAISVVLLRKTKWNPVFVMILAGVLKVLVALI